MNAGAAPGSRQALMVNRVLGDLAIYAVVLAAFAVFAGPRGLLFFCLQSAVAIIVLELFNYIAHYGLTAAAGRAGKPEALTDRHSWNSSNILANTLIFNMGRHSFHHARPSLSYQNLRQVEAAPELPAGYAGSILLALAPPLWRRVMDCKVRRPGSGTVMRDIAVIIAIAGLALTAPASFGQIVAPTLSPPPCMGRPLSWPPARRHHAACCRAIDPETGLSARHRF